MAKRFDQIRTDEARAQQIYLILIGMASQRRIATYGIIAEMIGFGGAGVLSNILGHIMFWCQDNELPSLTALVVNQETGLPGEGLVAADDLDAERERVFAFDWFAILPPTQLELEQSRGAHL